MKCFCIALFIISIAKINTKIIELRYEEIFNAYNIKVGLSSIYKYFEIDLLGKFSFIASGYYKNSEHAIVKEKGMINFYDYQNVSYDLLSDQIDFGNPKVSLNDFTFYYFLPGQNIQRFDSISLSYNQNKSISFIYNFYSKNIIDELSFSLVYSRGNDGYLFLGGIPPTYIINTYSGSCNINDRYDNWGCQVRAVLLGNKEFTIKDGYGYLSATQSEISVPKTFLTFLNETYFQQYFDQGDCFVNEVIDKNDFISFETDCNCSVYETFPQLKFILGNIKISLNGRSLFKKEVDKCRLIIKENMNDENTFIFGISLLRLFHILFDYDKKSITFYSKEIIEQAEDFQEQNSKLLLLSNCVLLSLTISFWLVLKCYKKCKINNIIYYNVSVM